jgi:hypothetical protein
MTRRHDALAAARRLVVDLPPNPRAVYDPNFPSDIPITQPYDDGLGDNERTAEAAEREPAGKAGISRTGSGPAIFADSADILTLDEAGVERLARAIHDVWGWCEDEPNGPSDAEAHQRLCVGGADALRAALSAGSAEPDEPEAGTPVHKREDPEGMEPTQLMPCTDSAGAAANVRTGSSDGEGPSPRRLPEEPDA